MHPKKLVSDVTYQKHVNATYVYVNPSLKGLTSNFVFDFIYKLYQLQLSSTTTYEQYVSAENSKTLPYERLLPDIYPEIENEYYTRYQFPIQRMHVACCPFLLEEGIRSPNGRHIFDFEVKAVTSVISSRLWWCCHCNWTLFIGYSPCVRLEH